MRAKAQRGDARAAAGLGGVRTRHGKKKALTGGDHVAVSVRDGREGASGWAGAKEKTGRGRRYGPSGKREGRGGTSWARRKSNGPTVERFWAAGKKRKRDGVGPAGLKWLRGKRNVLHFF